MERAEQVGGSRTIALTVRAAVAAYIGRESEARADAAAALAIAARMPLTAAGGVAHHEPWASLRFRLAATPRR